jgi:hypothetical protein
MAMRDTGLVVFAVVAAGLVWVGVSAQQQEVRTTPGPGSGVIDVRGTVSLAGVSEVRLSDVPDVNVVHLPPVRVAAVPPITIAGPGFITRGARYVVTWPTGERESITVAEVAQGSGWVQVGTSRWVNLDAARAVERAP